MTDKAEIENVSSWWNQNPQLYGDTAHAEPNLDYYLQLDAALMDHRYDGGPCYADILDRLLGPHAHAGKSGLEIGYGSGWLIEWLTRRGVDMTGIDLTTRAWELTKRRFELKGLKAEILHGDGRELPFTSEKFDLVCSVGVLHHSPNTRASIQEVWRVLKPGGKAFIMLYARDSFFSLFVHGIRGWLEQESQFLDNKGLWKRWTDGWEEEGNQWTTPFTRREIGVMFEAFRSVETVSFDFNFPHPLARLVPARLRRALARRFGWFRYVIAEK